MTQSDFTIFLGVAAVVFLLVFGVRYLLARFSGRRPTGIAAGHDHAEFRVALGNMADLARETIYQSRVSFWTSIVAAAAGFIAILYTALVLGPELDSTQLAIRFLASVVVEAVSALFFVQSRRAQTEIQKLYERLWRDFDVLKALNTTVHIHDNKTRDGALLKIIDSCLESRRPGPRTVGTETETDEE